MGFQFTPLREGRRCKPIYSDNAHYFNSRPSARGDAVLRVVFLLFVFQFTPLREGRLRRRHARAQVLSISIHAPPRGATPRRRPIHHLQVYFNSRPSARGDAHSKVSNQARHLFQFTPLREGRLEPGEEEAVPAQFQFTPLREGRRAPH